MCSGRELFTPTPCHMPSAHLDGNSRATAPASRRASQFTGILQTPSNLNITADGGEGAPPSYLKFTNAISLWPNSLNKRSLLEGKCYLGGALLLTLIALARLILGYSIAIFGFTFVFSREINILLPEPYSRKQWLYGGLDRLLSPQPSPHHPQVPPVRKGDRDPLWSPLLYLNF